MVSTWRCCTQSFHQTCLGGHVLISGYIAVPAVAVLWICISWGRVGRIVHLKVCKNTVHWRNVYCHATSVFLECWADLGQTLFHTS
jgi:hypothetical protein